MNEVDEILGNANGGNSVQADNTAGTTTTPQDQQPVKEVEVNGRKYTPEQFEELAKDTTELTKKLAQQGQELGELRKLKEEPKEDIPQIDPTQAEFAKKALKSLGFVTKDEQETQEYLKAATTEIKRIADTFGVKAEDFAKELDETGMRLPVNKIEQVFKVNHPDEYLAWRQKQIASDKPVTPFTERPVKEGIELPSATKPKLGENVVDMALEMLGVRE